MRSGTEISQIIDNTQNDNEENNLIVNDFFEVEIKGIENEKDV